MLVIRPLPIEPANVTASNAGSDDPVYSATTSYTLNARVYLPDDGRTYECVQAPALNKPPASSPLYWIRAEPSNRWAMWDTEISTASKTTGNLTATVALQPRFNAVGVFGLVGAAITLTQKNASGAVLWTETRQLLSNPSGWYGYFYEPRQQVRDVVFTGLTPSVGSSLELLVTPTGGQAACAAVVVGNSMHIGDAQYGATAGITSYSKKDTNVSTGVITLKKGKRSKRMSLQLMQERGQFNAIHAALDDLDATPAVWLGVEGSADYEPFIVLGFYKDFQIEASYPMHHLCSLEIEGMT